jgi:uncharacterized protein YuzE
MITRYRGDTQRLNISLSSGGVKVDLTTVNKVELGVDKEGTVLVIECIKDADPTSGVVYAPFIPTDLDVVGTFSFDVQVSWYDGTKTTILIDRFKILDDVNKT